MLRALKYAVNEAQKRQHNETAGHGPEAHQMRTHFNIIIYVSIFNFAIVVGDHLLIALHTHIFYSLTLVMYRRLARATQ